MLKHLIAWAFICSAAPVVFSQNYNLTDSSPEDSINFSISPRLLDEIVITASPIINKNDGKVFRLNNELQNSSSDGIDVLRKLQISKLTINPLTNQIGVLGNGKVILCINGIESTSSQVAGINPKDILRIEYHENPGIRYDDAAVVIDYITSRHNSGSSLFLNSFDCIGKGRWASIDNFMTQYNHDRSVWTINASYFGKQTDNWIRDYNEVWYYPNTTVTRDEYGLPVSISNHTLESNINYNYMHPSGNILNIRLGFNLEDIPNKEEGDRRAILKISNLLDSILIMEHTEEHILHPNLGLYYQHKLTDNNSIILNATTSYIHSTQLHEYSENETFQSSIVRGNKYDFKFLGMFQKHIGSQVWKISLMNNSSLFMNTYITEERNKVNISQSETSLMGEYSNRFGNWGIMGYLKASYQYMKQKTRSQNGYFILPEINISYRPINSLFLKYSISIDHKMPTAAEISDVEQPIQIGMIRRGNPNLKSFRIIDQSFDISFDHHIININPHVEYRNEHNPIMESVLFENNQFVRTFLNQHSFQRLIVGGSITAKPWKDHISISVSPTLTRYFSHGINYSHCHNIFRVGLNIDFSYKNWLLYGNIMSGPENYMYGEEIIEEKDMNSIMVGYKREKWSIHAGVFNAFINYWMESRNLSALTPYTSKANSKNSSYFCLKFNILLNYGRKTRKINIEQNDTNSDSGILSTTK